MKKTLYFVAFFLITVCFAQAQTKVEKSLFMQGSEGVLTWDVGFSESKPETRAAQPTFAGGTGTEEDPYLISTKEHMKSLVMLARDETGSGAWPQLLKGIYFKQMADLIYEKGDQRPSIGILAWFAGTYDGNNYAIRNYNYTFQGVIDRSKGSDPANKKFGESLFLNVNGATIKNVKMIDTRIDIDVECDTIFYRSAVLASFSKNSQFINCTVSGTYSLKVKGTASEATVSGLIGEATNCLIDNCQNIVDIYCELNSNGGNSCFAQAGGLVASAVNSTIINCSSKGDVVANGYGKGDELVVRSAGLVAWAKNSQILNSCNKSDLLSGKANNIQQTGLSFVQVAGMVSAMTGGTLDNCWTIAPMKCEGYNAQVSGAAAIGHFWENPTIQNCHYQQTELKSLRADAEGITGHTSEFMKSQAFIDLLNVHLPKGGLLWKNGTAGYPGIFAAHNVTLPLLTGATINPSGGTHEIEDREYFRFTLVLDEEYNQSKPIVTTSTGQTLVPDANMNYITEPVIKDMSISIAGIVKNPAMSNEDITINQKVYATGNILSLLTDTPALVEVFNVQGQKEKSIMILGNTQMQLLQGFYIVRMAGQSYKVCISK